MQPNKNHLKQNKQSLKILNTTHFHSFHSYNNKVINTNVRQFQITKKKNYTHTLTLVLIERDDRTCDGYKGSWVWWWWWWW